MAPHAFATTVLGGKKLAWKDYVKSFDKVKNLWSKADEADQFFRENADLIPDDDFITSDEFIQMRKEMDETRGSKTGVLFDVIAGRKLDLKALGYDSEDPIPCEEN